MTTEIRLSPREIEILKLVARGWINKEMMPWLGLSEQTIKSHLYRAFEKLGVECRTSAAVKAIQLGVIEFPNGDEYR